MSCVGCICTVDRMPNCTCIYLNFNLNYQIEHTSTDLATISGYNTGYNIKVILCASEHICSMYDIASEALDNFKTIHYMY